MNKAIDTVHIYCAGDYNAGISSSYWVINDFGFFYDGSFEDDQDLNAFREKLAEAFSIMCAGFPVEVLFDYEVEERERMLGADEEESE